MPAEYNERVSVPFPGDPEFAVSVPEGSNNLYNAIYTHRATSGTPLTIGGVSKGAPSAVDVLYRLVEDAENPVDGITAPSRHQMNVAIYGAPGKIFFIGTKCQPIPETPYDILMVVAEYDGIADFRTIPSISSQSSTPCGVPNSFMSTRRSTTWPTTPCITGPTRIRWAARRRSSCRLRVCRCSRTYTKAMSSIRSSPLPPEGVAPRHRQCLRTELGIRAQVLEI